MDNIPSESVNAIVESAKRFIELIVKPAAKEFGLLLEDQVRSWRVKNQINILIKAQKHVEAKGIRVTTIPLKILVPLLDQASLEEEEKLQNIWAILLSNMLDADSNYQNHIFPYILSQLSIEDFQELEELWLKEEKYLADRKRMRELQEMESVDVNYGSDRTFKVHKNKSEEFLDLESQHNMLTQEGFIIWAPESDNLNRLGLIRELPPKIVIDEFSTRNEDYEELIKLDAKYDEYFGFRITDLGEMFIKACKEKE